MYDTIVIEKIICPHCRQTISDFEFQSKETKSSNFLGKYKFPDVLVSDNGKYPLEGVCEICASFIKGTLIIDNGLTKKISYWVENCPVYILVPNLEDSLKENLIDVKHLKEMNSDLLGAVKALLVKIDRNEKISKSAIKELEKMFDFSLEKEKGAVSESAPIWMNFVGTKKYYIVLSKE